MAAAKKTTARATSRTLGTQENQPEATAAVPSEERMQMVAEAAYFRAEQRGFQNGSPQNDWLEAEAEVDARPSQE